VAALYSKLGHLVDKDVTSFFDFKNRSEFGRRWERYDDDKGKEKWRRMSGAKEIIRRYCWLDVL
jgi:hypothetical protein